MIEHRTDNTPEFIQTVLTTGPDGKAVFIDRRIAMPEGKPLSRLSALQASSGYQLRFSPVGFESQFHCTTDAQWVFILQGQMEIRLQDGLSRVFSPGQHFYSADLLPHGAVFDPKIHGHASRQLGTEPLVTLFLRD